MFAAGSDMALARELSEKRSTVQLQIDGLYAQWEELEELLSEVA